jgi:hypothetical protein
VVSFCSGQNQRMRQNYGARASRVSVCPQDSKGNFHEQST